MIGDSKQTKSRKERITPKHYLPYLTISKNSKTLHGRGSNHIQSTTSMAKYNLYRFFHLSAVIHIHAPQLSTKARFNILFYTQSCAQFCG